MRIEKSTRHKKIIGQYGEYLVCNWLSRAGWEVSIIDHTGIDIIAYNQKLDRRIGISVKSRTREAGQEGEPVNIFAGEKRDRIKIGKACLAFECEPWIGIYVETLNYAELYLTSLSNYDKKYRRKSRHVNTWQMKDANRKEYRKDDKVKYIRIDFIDENWNWDKMK